MENDTATVEVPVGDLLWVLIEYGLLVVASDHPAPPSMEAALRLVEMVPEGSAHLPPEAEGSAALAGLIAELGLD